MNAPARVAVIGSGPSGRDVGATLPAPTTATPGRSSGGSSSTWSGCPPYLPTNAPGPEPADAAETAASLPADLPALRAPARPGPAAVLARSGGVVVGSVSRGSEDLP